MEVSVIILQNHLIAVLGKNYQLSWFSLLQTQVPKKSSSASPEITHYYFDHFYPSLARSTITRIVFGRYVGGRQQDNLKRNLCTTEQHKHISLSFFPSSSRSFCVILWCDSSLPFYIFWAVNKKDTVSLIC